MPLDEMTRRRIRAMAEQRGQDPDAAVSAAESMAGGSSPGEFEEGAAGRPTFERLLIGVLPFIKVRELRSIWLGLPERVQDDEMFCGEFAAKHGGAASAPAAPEAE